MIEQKVLSFNLFHVKHSPNRSSPLLSFSFLSLSLSVFLSLSFSLCNVSGSRHSAKPKHHPSVDSALRFPDLVRRKSDLLSFQVSMCVCVSVCVCVCDVGLRSGAAGSRA